MDKVFCLPVLLTNFCLLLARLCKVTSVRNEQSIMNMVLISVIIRQVLLTFIYFIL